MFNFWGSLHNSSLFLFHGVLHRVTNDLAIEFLRIGSFADDLMQILDFYAVLSHGVAVTNGHASVFLRVIQNGVPIAS